MQSNDKASDLLVFLEDWKNKLSAKSNEMEKEWWQKNHDEWLKDNAGWWENPNGNFWAEDEFWYNRHNLSPDQDEQEH